MNYRTGTNLRLSARNEGKIKAYGSCCDVRAWSHDSRDRDRYLREWIKSDMTVGVIPVTVLTNLLRTMTRKSRGNVVPRCHPDCKSKVILESICASCDAMKECLKSDDGVQKFLQEEEFETSHWPCDKCLEALKNIKLFWKVLIDRILGLSLTSNVEHVDYSHSDNVRSVAKEWKEEIVQQTLLIKGFKPLFNKSQFLRNNLVSKDSSRDDAVFHIKDDKSIVFLKTATDTSKSFKTTATDTDCLSSYLVSKPRRTSHSRQLNNTVDAACQTCSKENELKESDTIKRNLLELQQRFTEQNDELDKIRTENHSLKMELQQIYKSWCCKCTLSSHKYSNRRKDLTPIPKPFETCVDESIKPHAVKDIMSSETVITFKNCKNETYRHISLLQVVHKTNGPIVNDLNLCGTCCRNEDPINLLTRVKNTFGQMVKREMSIANDRSHRSRKIDINASFHKMTNSTSAPSCTTTSTSESDCIVPSRSERKFNKIITV